jgi:hypothetical protein
MSTADNVRRAHSPAFLRPAPALQMHCFEPNDFVEAIVNLLSSHSQSLTVLMAMLQAQLALRLRGARNPSPNTR